MLSPCHLSFFQERPTLQAILLQARVHFLLAQRLASTNLPRVRTVSRVGSSNPANSPVAVLPGCPMASVCITGSAAVASR